MTGVGTFWRGSLGCPLLPPTLPYPNTPLYLEPLSPDVPSCNSSFGKLSGRPSVPGTCQGVVVT